MLPVIEELLRRNYSEADIEKSVVGMDGNWEKVEAVAKHLERTQ